MYTIQTHTESKFKLGQKVLAKNYSSNQMEQGTIVSLNPEIWLEGTKWLYNVILAPYDEGYGEESKGIEPDIMDIFEEGKFQIYEEYELTPVTPATAA